MVTSPKSEYESRYGATRKITAAQRLAEIACERRAGGLGVSLPSRFWETVEWSGEFRTQLRAASALLKAYDADAVFAALAAHPKIYSMTPAFFREKVAIEQGRIDRERARAEDPQAAPSNPNETPRRGAPKGRGVRGMLAGGKIQGEAEG